MSPSEMAMDERMREQETRIERLELQIGLLGASQRLYDKEMRKITQALSAVAGLDVR